MPLTLPFNDNLQEALSATAKTMRVQGGSVDLCAALAAPAHAFATVYTLNRSERVLVHSCNGDGSVNIVRGAEGTTARAWPANACVKITELVPGTVCPDEDSEVSGCPVFDPVVSVPLGKGLKWDVTDASNPRLTLAATGVVPTNMACGEINECGQFVSIPAGWPASCLTPFDPCCGDSGGGSSPLDACSVPYSPSGGSGAITASTVCGALDQLADLVGGATGDVGVQSITAGDCIDVSGPASAPTISVAPTGVTAGVYAGFTVNECGQIVSYTPETASTLQITGTSPITATLSSGAYTISVAAATSSALGVVQLADAAEAANASPTVDDDHVITWEFLQLWAQTQGLI